MRFRKDWKIERQINDDPPIMGALKIARVRPREYISQEKIYTPLMDGTVAEGVQAYHIVRTGQLLEIYFATGAQKGKLFQRFDMRSPECEQVHHCGADIYKSKLKLVSRTEVYLQHQVSGPRKSYMMKTRYFTSSGTDLQQ